MENKPVDPVVSKSKKVRPSLSPGINIWFLPLAFVVGVLVGYALWGRSLGSNSVAAANSTPAAGGAVAIQTPEQIKRYNVPIDGNPTLGPENAPITLIEFSDFQCPYCLKWEQEVYQRLLQNYGDKVRFVYRDFPLTSIHPQAMPAAEAADCANEQGAFWKYHDKLFSGENPLGSDTYTKYATELGLDLPKFQQCLSEHRYQKEVQGDMDFAANLGINSTPTFFINGIPIVGAQPYEVFSYVIDKELAGELPK